MLYYLLSTCFGSLSNILGQYFKNIGVFAEYNLMYVYFHIDFINLAVFFVIYFVCKLRGTIHFSLKDTFLRKEEVPLVFFFAIPILASAYKTYMMNYIRLADIEISAMVKPFCVCGLAIIFLGEKFYHFYIKYGLLAVIGFLIVNIEIIPFYFNSGTGRLSFSTSSYGNTNLKFLLPYLALASIGDVTRRYYCRQCKYTMQGVCVEFVMFALYGIIFLIYRNTFSFKILFSPYALIVSLITILHHFCLIHGVQKAHSVTALEFVNFSKIIFTIIFSYLILGYRAPGYKIVGAIIIAVTLILFNRRLRKIAKK
jgi:drug/metabolite transporter (DMT)-like permease